VLVIVGGVFLATEDIRRNLSRVDDLERRVADMSQMVSDLHSVLLALPEAAEVRSQRTASSGDQTQVFVVPDGTRYHTADCPMVAGKAKASAISANSATQRSMEPCSVCNAAAVISV